ncbi:MAG: DUF2269 domain-containing protein [Gammaproteobacteria bacterium]|nr:DUF2269 domain-containing protein [Gammaproteobacteria bacterium]
MLYLWLKFIHVVSSTILFGTGIGTAYNLFLAHKTKDVAIISATTRYVVAADWVFTGSSGFVQALTGLWMVFIAGYPLSSLWILGSIIGYLIAALCWFPVVYFQIRMRDLANKAHETHTPLPPLFYQYYRRWFWLGWPAFISLIIVFYLMTNKPSF